MTLQAGTGIRDITPPVPMALYGYPHVERILTGVHDPLPATALILRNGPSSTVVLISLDILMIGPAFAHDLRRAVAQVAGCEENGVFISCTHTHSGPVTSRLIGWGNDETIPAVSTDYMAFLKTQVVEAARAAAQSMTPAELAWTSANATGIGGNRLRRGGLTDPECGILAVRNSQTKTMLGMVLVYGMHPTVLHEDSTLVSADFPYYTRLHIREHLGSELPIVYQMAPAGNQSPRHFVNGQTFAEAERLGRLLGKTVCGALDAIRPGDWQTEVKLQGERVPLKLPRNPVRPLHEAEALVAEYREHYARLQRENAPRADIRTAECAVFGAEGTLALSEAGECGDLEKALQEYSSIEVQVLQIGNAFLAGLPGEAFAEYALEIKAGTTRKVFVASLVNGELQGYIVTPEAAEAGGYEATNAIFAPESGKLLVDAVLKTIGKLI